MSNNTIAQNGFYAIADAMNNNVTLELLKLTVRDPMSVDNLMERFHKIKEKMAEVDDA